MWRAQRERKEKGGRGIDNGDPLARLARNQAESLPPGTSSAEFETRTIATISGFSNDLLCDPLTLSPAQPVDGQLLSFFHRRTVRSLRFKYAAISFQESRRSGVGRSSTFRSGCCTGGLFQA
jgi:hypothetical protein